jgi:hypothetical protein
MVIRSTDTRDVLGNGAPLPNASLAAFDQIAPVWLDAQQAAIVGWPDETELLQGGLPSDLPVIEELWSGVRREELAELLVQFARRHDTPLTVVSRHVARRPTRGQLRARLRDLSGIVPQPLPRGGYRWTRDLPETASGHLLPASAAGRRKATARRASAQREIEIETSLDETG